jgi:hypothetical protein
MIKLTNSSTDAFPQENTKNNRFLLFPKRQKIICADGKTAGDGGRGFEKHATFFGSRCSIWQS